MTEVHHIELTAVSSGDPETILAVASGMLKAARDRNIHPSILLSSFQFINMVTESEDATVMDSEENFDTAVARFLKVNELPWSSKELTDAMHWVALGFQGLHLQKAVKYDCVSLATQILTNAEKIYIRKFHTKHIEQYPLVAMGDVKIQKVTPDTTNNTH